MQKKGRFCHTDEEENLSQSACFKFHDGKGGSGGLSWVAIIMGQWSLSRGDRDTDQSKLKEKDGEQDDRSIAVSLLSAILVGEPSFIKFKLYSVKKASIIRPLEN